MSAAHARVRCRAAVVGLVATASVAVMAVAHAVVVMAGVPVAAAIMIAAAIVASAVLWAILAARVAKLPAPGAMAASSARLIVSFNKIKQKTAYDIVRRDPEGDRERDLRLQKVQSVQGTHQSRARRGQHTGEDYVHRRGARLSRGPARAPLCWSRRALAGGGPGQHQPQAF